MSTNSLHLGNKNIFALFKNTLGKRIIPRLLTKPSITQNDNDNQDDYNEILKTHQIPGRYLHYFKKSRRQLKNEARQSNEAITRISARKSRSDYTMKANAELKSNNDDNPSLPFKGHSSAQQNIAKRLSRAIIKCNDDVPHNYLNSTFVRIMNIGVSPELNVVRVWWKPDPQKGISESKIENAMNKHSINYRNILQRAMHMRNPPKIVFLRFDTTLGNINELLDNIEVELKSNPNKID